jgi:hypothetical protein
VTEVGAGALKRVPERDCTWMSYLSVSFGAPSMFYTGPADQRLLILIKNY